MLSLGMGLCRFTMYLETDCMPLILEETRNWVGRGYWSQRHLEKFPTCRTHPTIWMQGQHFYVCNAYAAFGLIGYSQRIHFLRNSVCKHVSLWIFNLVVFLFQSLCQRPLDWRWCCRWCFVLKRRKLLILPMLHTESYECVILGGYVDLEALELLKDSVCEHAAANRGPSLHRALRDWWFRWCGHGIPGGSWSHLNTLFQLLIALGQVFL